MVTINKQTIVNISMTKEELDKLKMAIDTIQDLFGNELNISIDDEVYIDLIKHILTIHKTFNINEVPKETYDPKQLNSPKQLTTARNPSNNKLSICEHIVKLLIQNGDMKMSKIRDELQSINPHLLGKTINTIIRDNVGKFFEQPKTVTDPKIKLLRKAS